MCGVCAKEKGRATQLMAKKVLITGASGLLGREVLRCFEAANWQVLGLAYSRATGNLQKVDLTDASQVEAIMKKFQPGVVIHAAAERRPDVVEKQTSQARALNVIATKCLSALCKKHNSYLLYISTDYVFDGKKPPYAPDAPTNPLNAYGISKRDGEQEVIQYPSFGILRVPVLYGCVESLGESAVTTLLSSVMNRDKPAEMNDYQQRYPTHVSNCAEVCVHLAMKQVKGGNAGGIWHFTGSEVHTKYSMAVVMAEVFGLSKDHLIPVKDSGGATRPYDCHLDSSSIMNNFPIKCIPFKEGIRDALQDFPLPNN